MVVVGRFEVGWLAGLDASLEGLSRNEEGVERSSGFG